MSHDTAPLKALSIKAKPQISILELLPPHIHTEEKTTANQQKKKNPDKCLEQMKDTSK